MKKYLTPHAEILYYKTKDFVTVSDDLGTDVFDDENGDGVEDSTAPTQA